MYKISVPISMISVNERTLPIYLEKFKKCHAERVYLCAIGNVYSSTCLLKTNPESLRRAISYFRENGYWNGAVWMPHQWFIWKAALDAGKGDFAWKMIDGIGYRGFKVNDVLVSEKHSNFIVNTGEGKADDYLSIVYQIQDKVKEKYGVKLIMEVEKFNC